MTENNVIYFNPLFTSVPCFNSDYELVWLNLNVSKPFMLSLTQIEPAELISKTRRFYNEIGGAREWKKYQKVLLKGAIFIVDTDYLFNL